MGIEGTAHTPGSATILGGEPSEARRGLAGVSWLGAERNPGSGFALGGSMILLFTTAAEAVFPGYSVHTDAISYLGGAGVATALFWDGQLFVAGLLWLWSSGLLFRWHLRPWRSLPFYLTSAGMIMVSVAPWNLLPSVHGIGALMVLLFGIGSCVVGARMTHGEMRGVSYLAASISLAAFLVGFLGDFGPLGPGGLERMYYYPIFLWEIAFGGYLLGGGTTMGSNHGGDGLLRPAVRRGA